MHRFEKWSIARITGAAAASLERQPAARHEPRPTEGRKAQRSTAVGEERPSDPTVEALRHDLARRHAGPRHVSLGSREGRVVVRALDDLGVHYIEAGFPGSNPKEAELFELLADEELRSRRRLRLRDDPPARCRGRRGRGARGPRLERGTGGDAGRQVVGPAPRQGDARSRREENLAMIADSVGYLPAGHGKRVIFDAEHFFDGVAPMTPPTRSSACRPPSPPAPRTSSSATPTAA